jgi:hypothetical protein
MADAKLDPRAFGLAGDAISFKEYMKRLNAGISKLPKELGLYVDLVVDYLNDGKVSADDLKKALSKPSVTAYKRKILTDFGETLGPLGIVKFKLFKGADNKCLIRYPTRQNEGMYDYMMSFNRGKSWNKISAKAKTGKSNTVKPGDILNLLEDAVIPSQLKTAYEFVKLISDNTTNEGSQIAMKYLQSKSVNGIPQKKFDKKVLCETVFEQITKDTSNSFGNQMNDLFWLAIQNGELEFIKFGLAGGTPIYDRVNDGIDIVFEDGNKLKRTPSREDIKPRVYFRGKGREAGEKRAEKPGFQT